MLWTRPAILVLTIAAAAPAQTRTYVAAGQVTRASEKGRPDPVAGQWIVLHRVGSDRAAPVDSARSASDGRYRIRYRPSGAADALYFVSATYRGITYFSPPLRSAVVDGGDADVLVYDTTTDTTSLRIQGRHFVLSAPRGAAREVVEVFEIANEGARTIVARDSTAAILSIALPEDARDAAVTQGDVTAAAVRIRDGRADIFAPISPGVRQLVLTYLLPFDAFPLSLPVARKTTVLEVLLEESRASAQGATLGEVASATIENRVFRRFLAQDVPASSVARISAPAPVASRQTAMRVLAVVMAILMLGALGFWLVRRRPRSGAMRPPSEVERLIAQLATLDATFERDSAAGAGGRQRYEQERATLKERISRALAAEESRV